MLKITHSLLSSWMYATEPDTAPERYESFLRDLRREKREATKAMEDGRAFEFLVNCAADGIKIDCDDADWLKAAQKFGRLCAGGVQQVRVEGTKRVNGEEYRLVGVADVVKAGRIFDIKKVVRYEYGKYQFSTQHPMYFELMPGATRFDYLIFDGKMCYTETYRRGDFVPIEITIREFTEFLKAQNLWKIYQEKWEV